MTGGARETMMAMLWGFACGVVVYLVTSTIWRLSQKNDAQNTDRDMDRIRASQGAGGGDDDDDDDEGEEWKRTPRRRPRRAVRPKELDDPDRHRDGGDRAKRQSNP